MKPEKYPIVHEIVMVVPIRITDLGVYVGLMEYDNIEGLIILSDLSKNRYRSINKVITLGKKFPAMVLTVEQEANHITLSKKAVSEDEAKECELAYKTSKYIYDLVHLFVRKLEKDHNIILDTKDAYYQFIWPISSDPEHLIFALKSASKEFFKVYEKKLDTIDKIVVDCFKETLATKFREKEVTVEAVLDITCFETAGINTIRSALLHGQSMATEDYPFKIKLVKSPYYSITLKTADQGNTVQLINSVIETIQTDLFENGASVKIIKKPEVVIDKEFEPENSDEEDDLIASLDASLTDSLTDI